MAAVGAAFEDMALAFGGPGGNKPKAQKRGRDKRPRKLWSAAEDVQLRRDFSNTLTPEIAHALNRTALSVYQRAHLLGLKKDPAFVLETNRKLGAALATHPTSVANRFQKGRDGGFRSPAARAAFLRGGKQTRFHKGNRPQTWRPVGSVLVDGEGYSWTKVSEGARNVAFRATHVMLWEKHNGAVPEGHVVVFKDKNKANITIDNLEIVTRADLMARNTIHLYPADLKMTIRALGKLKRIIRRKDEKQD